MESNVPLGCTSSSILDDLEEIAKLLDEFHSDNPLVLGERGELK